MKPWMVLPEQSETQERMQPPLHKDLLELPLDPALDDFVRLALHACGVARGFIVLFDGPRARIYSQAGFSAGELPRDFPLPTFVTHPSDLVILEDAGRFDPEFTFLVRAFPGIRFYASAAITTTSGEISGLLCLVDQQPRSFTPSQRESLRLIARQVTARLDQDALLLALERDVRTKGRIEQALTVERNFVNATLDTVGSLVLVLDTAGRIVRFNRTCEIVSGFPFSELVGRPFWERLVPPQDREQVMRRFEAIRAGAFPQSYEHPWVTASGQIRFISWTATALLDSQGAVNFVITTGMDVTRRRHAEAVIRESEARYRQLIENSLGIVCTHDMHGALLSINRHAARSLGYEPEELTGHRLSDLMPPQHLEAFEQYIDTLARDGEDQGFIYLRHKTGEVSTVAARSRVIHVEGREPFVICHGVDITTQVRTERQLQALSRQSQSILEAVGDGIYATDLQGRCTIINPAAAAMLGYTQQELLGHDIHNIAHHSYPDGRPYPAANCPILRSFDSAIPIRIIDEVFWRKDGSSFPVEYVARPQLDNGVVIGMVIAFQDISERHALDRMKDEFISTVSHELRTPLTSLRGALGLIVGGTLESRPDKEAQMFDIAVANCDRLVQLVNDILDLERIEGGKLQLNPVDCNVDQLLSRAASLMESAAVRAGIRMEVTPSLLHAFADPDRILQTLTNLLGNAIKFSPRGSAVRIYARSVAPLAKDGYIQITICDKGRGIPPTKLDTIFERFQQVDASDSRAMGGTGLGLAICRSIVNQHGGRIWVESTPGEGSCFHFTLPAQPGNSQPGLSHSGHSQSDTSHSAATTPTHYPAPYSPRE
jgi:two-component system sensor histidine kinase VicK